MHRLQCEQFPLAVTESQRERVNPPELLLLVEPWWGKHRGICRTERIILGKDVMVRVQKQHGIQFLQRLQCFQQCQGCELVIGRGIQGRVWRNDRDRVGGFDQEPQVFHEAGPCCLGSPPRQKLGHGTTPEPVRVLLLVFRV